MRILFLALLSVAFVREGIALGEDRGPVLAASSKESLVYDRSGGLLRKEVPIDKISQCPHEHCSKISPVFSGEEEIELVRGLKLKRQVKPPCPAGKKITVEISPGAYCTCICSCVTGDTQIRLWDGRSEALARRISEEEEVLVPHSEHRYASVERVMVSKAEGAMLRRVAFSNGRSLYVSSNHTFVRSNKSIASAEELRVGDMVLDGNSQATSVVRNEVTNKYWGKLYNVIVNATSTRPTEHIVITNDIQSGDWLLQSAQDSIQEAIDLRLGKIPWVSEKGEDRRMR